MNTQVKRNWGMFAVGILAVIVGFVMFFFPGITLLSAAIVFGIMLCCIGVIDLIFYASNREGYGMSGWAAVVGVLDIVLGVLFLFDPLISAEVLPFLAGIYMLCYGIFQLITSYQLRGVPGNGWLIFSGIVAVLVSFVFFAAPLMFSFFLACYLVARGIAMIAGGLNTKYDPTTTNTQYPYGV